MPTLKAEDMGSFKVLSKGRCGIQELEGTAQETAVWLPNHHLLLRCMEVIPESIRAVHLTKPRPDHPTGAEGNRTSNTPHLPHVARETTKEATGNSVHLFKTTTAKITYNFISWKALQSSERCPQVSEKHLQGVGGCQYSRWSPFPTLTWRCPHRCPPLIARSARPRTEAHAHVISK